MMVARCPNFVEKEAIGRLNSTMEIVRDAAIFTPGGPN
jgi:hypothetical protein